MQPCTLTLTQTCRVLSLHLFHSESLLTKACLVRFDQSFTVFFTMCCDAFVSRKFCLRARATNFFSTLPDLRLRCYFSPQFRHDCVLKRSLNLIIKYKGIIIHEYHLTSLPSPVPGILDWMCWRGT